jgi:PPOX class probable F420-dependent enzyme
VGLEALGEPKYILLTTYRKDGTPVSTPVWCVRDGFSLRVATQGSSGKARRIRNNERVTVAPCDMRGRPRGLAVPASARIDDPARSAETARLVARRYGLIGWFMLRKSDPDRVGITDTPR